MWIIIWTDHDNHAISNQAKCSKIVIETSSYSTNAIHKLYKYSNHNVSLWTMPENLPVL